MDTSNRQSGNWVGAAEAAAGTKAGPASQKGQEATLHKNFLVVHKKRSCLVPCQSGSSTEFLKPRCRCQLSKGELARSSVAVEEIPFLSSVTEGVQDLHPPMVALEGSPCHPSALEGTSCLPEAPEEIPGIPSESSEGILCPSSIEEGVPDSPT